MVERTGVKMRGDAGHTAGLEAESLDLQSGALGKAATTAFYTRPFVHPAPDTRGLAWGRVRLLLLGSPAATALSPGLAPEQLSFPGPSCPGLPGGSCPHHSHVALLAKGHWLPEASRPHPSGCTPASLPRAASQYLCEAITAPAG